jgi:transposase-like protein
VKHIYKHPKSLRLKVSRMLEAGASASEVAQRFKVNISTVYAWTKASRQVMGRAPGVHSTKPVASKSNGHAKDAIVYLRHAKRAMGVKALEDPVCLYAMLALNTLEGKL